MSPETLDVDGSLSWARRVDDSVSVHLRLPGTALPPGALVVELVGPNGRMRSNAEVSMANGAVEVVFTLPRGELGSSAWRVTIQSPDKARFMPVEARLLAGPDSPVALLPGPAPTTRVRAPTPRPRRPLAVRLAARLPTPVREILRRTRTGGRAVVARLRS